MEPVIINLDGERDACTLTNTKELIHPTEFYQALDFIEDSSKKAKNYIPPKPNEGLNRKHNTITLSGSRGSGKTTFLLSILKIIAAGKSFTFKERKFVFDDIEVLRLIDPTLIEEKDHLFVNVVSHIVNLVQSKADKLNCYTDPKSDDFNKFQEWEASFRKLADGMPSIDGLSGKSNTEWLDSEFIMEQGIRQTTAANQLENNFHIFVNNSLKFIGKRSFLIGFDDIDTSFSRGWPVLEILRKYITTPQIITILSGDLELYSALIRKKQWENFNINMLKAETEYKSTKYYGLVNHLEEQYLLKVLKPERRLQLKTIYVNQLLGQTYNIKDNEEDPNETEMKKFYYDSGFPKLNINSIVQKDLYYSFIANLPFRFQKQLLFAFRFGKNISIPSERALSDLVFEIFWSNWNQLNTDPASIRNQQDFAMLLLLKFLVNNNLLQDGFSLRPDNTDIVANGALFNAGVYLKSLFHYNHYFIFDYFIRIGLTRELSFLLDDKPSQNPYSINDYIKHCGLTAERNGRQNARMIASYIRGYTLLPKQKDLPFLSKIGTITLPALYQTRKRRERGQIDRLIEKDGKSLTQILGYLPASIATDHKGYNTPMYSIFNLFGIIEEVLFNLGSVKGDLESLKLKITETLSKNTQLRSYSIPNWASSRSAISDNILRNAYGADTGSDIGDEIVVSVDYQDIMVQKLVDSIFRWLENHVDCDMPMPYLLAKISTRFYYNLDSIDKAIYKIPHLGEWFHRLIIAFFNAVLVEDAMENIAVSNKEHLSINLTNPILRDDIFIKNFKSISIISKQTNSQLSFSSWITTCPLFLTYLDPVSDVFAELIKGLPIEKDIYSKDLNIYNFLSKISFKLKDEEETDIEKINFQYSSPSQRIKLKQYLKNNKISTDEILKMTIEDFLNNIIIQAFPDSINNIQERTFNSLKENIKTNKFKW
jgi:hypothetical protein